MEKLSEHAKKKFEIQIKARDLFSVTVPHRYSNTSLPLLPRENLISSVTHEGNTFMTGQKVPTRYDEVF